MYAVFEGELTEKSYIEFITKTLRELVKRKFAGSHRLNWAISNPAGHIGRRHAWFRCDRGPCQAQRSVSAAAVLGTPSIALSLGIARNTLSRSHGLAILHQRVAHVTAQHLAHQ